MEEYDIYIRGFAPHGEAPELGLRRVFGIDAQRARELVLSLPRVVKRRIAAEHVPRYERALLELGADYEVRPSPLRPNPIAVVGAPAAIGAREDESGLLTLPPESPNVPARVAPRFSQTVVGNLDMPLPAPASVPSVPSVPSASPPPVARTAEVSSPPPRAASAPATAQWGAADLPSTSSGWTAISPAYSNRPQDAGDLPPPPPEATNLGLGGRPDWLVDGPASYQEAIPLSAQPRSPVPSARAPGMSAGAPGMRESVPAKRPAPVTAQAPRPQVQLATGVAFQQEVAPSELPLPLRIGMRIALGGMLFIALTALRHCHALDRGVDRALSSWGTPGAEPPAETSARPTASAGDAFGPIAHEWMESDLHVFTNGDKDRVSNLILRFEGAGATTVHVAGIMRNGMVQVAAELVVVLPAEPDKRKAVFGEYEKFMRGTFGDFVAAPKDDGRDVLRITL